MHDLEEIFEALSKSAFRCRFRLAGQERIYLDRKGLPTVLAHAQEFITQRLAPANPRRDGRQTPFRGHPVFVAQHATGTCCRGCLEKWHGIPKGVPLTPDQQRHIVDSIERWLRGQQNEIIS